MPAYNFVYQRFGFKHAALLLAVLFAALYPFFQYVFDVDAVGYITVTQHYAAGAWKDAINGYWSPLNSWLMVPFVKIGLPPAICFKVANLCFGIGILYQTQKLLRAFSFTPKQKTGLLLTVTCMVLYYSFAELAADTLFIWMFLVYVNIVMKRNFNISVKANVCAGLMAAIVFFSKTYGLAFFLLHFSFIHFFWVPFVLKKGWHVKKFLLGMLAFALLVVPWICLLWYKYGFVTFGYAGKLNMSWMLMGGQPDYQPYFFEPAYNGALSKWVDPIYSQTNIYGPAQSKMLLLREIKVILYNIKIMVWDAFWISFFWPLILLGIWLKRKSHLPLQIVFWIILLFPIIYLLVVIEERYMWPISILMLMGGGYVLQRFFNNKKYAWLLLFMSFCIGPVIKLVQYINKDKAAHQLASYIQQNNIQGPFTSVDVDEEMHKAAFLTNNKYYAVAHQYGSFDKLETEARSKSIKVICVAYKNLDSATAFTQTAFFKTHQPELVAVDNMKMWLIRL